MSECEKCGEHCLDCHCKNNFDPRDFFDPRELDVLNPHLLFQAMVGVVGIKKTMKILTHYLEMKDFIENYIKER